MTIKLVCLWVLPGHSVHFWISRRLTFRGRDERAASSEIRHCEMHWELSVILSCHRASYQASTLLTSPLKALPWTHCVESCRRWRHLQARNHIIGVYLVNEGFLWAGQSGSFSGSRWRRWEEEGITPCNYCRWRRGRGLCNRLGKEAVTSIHAHWICPRGILGQSISPFSLPSKFSSSNKASTIEPVNAVGETAVKIGALWPLRRLGCKGRQV